MMVTFSEGNWIAKPTFEHNVKIDAYSDLLIESERNEQL